MNQLDLIYCVKRVNLNITQIHHFSVIDKGAVYVCTMFNVHEHAFFLTLKHRSSIFYFFFKDTSDCRLLTYFSCSPFSFAFVFLQRQTVTARHDGHSDKQQLGSLGVKRQTEEHAFEVSAAGRTLSDVDHSLCV